MHPNFTREPPCHDRAVGLCNVTMTTMLFFWATTRSFSAFYTLIKNSSILKIVNLYSFSMAVNEHFDSRFALLLSGGK